MSDSEKCNILKLMYGGDISDDMLNAYLALAGQEIIERAYPYNSKNKQVPEKYSALQIEIALYKLNKRGAEGQTSHNENGINRTYENADTPKSLLDRIVPFVGVGIK